MSEGSELRAPEPDDAAARRRRYVPRVLVSYALVTATFALAAGWSVFSLRRAAQEAELMRSGYLPLALVLRDLVANQDTWNAQLNRLTDSKNPAAERKWFDGALNIGRRKKFGEARSAIIDALGRSGAPSAGREGIELSHQATEIETYLAGDRELVGQLFDALDRGELERAQKLQDRLVQRGAQGRSRLAELERRVEHSIDALLDDARTRERQSLWLLVALSGFALLLGALYVRRVLQPLTAVTRRAEAVARGDLTPRPVVASKDEIGELATTFEGMVAAIARANAELLTAERLATVGKMAAHVTHEIRNPLSSIALNVELLEEELGGRESEAAGLLRAIKREVERLTSLSEEYLTMAKRQPPRLQEEDVAQIVRDAHAFVRPDLERHAVSVSLHIDEVLPALRVDEAQIRQALLNLVRNARESMPEGGRIEIGVHRQNGSVELSVDDEGPGIPEAARTRLFEPFFTTKSTGTGLGLAITRQIVEAHGGSIACEPRAPRGTRFVIRLPAG